jgi:hypothetical protein
MELLDHQGTKASDRGTSAAPPRFINAARRKSQDAGAAPHMVKESRSALVVIVGGAQVVLAQESLETATVFARLLSGAADIST